MKKNVGKTDAIIRVVLAILLGVGYFSKILSGTVGIVALIIAIVLLLTAIIGFCGIYALFGINTCKLQNKE